MLVRRLAWLAAVIPAITMAVATCGDGARPREGPPDTGPAPGPTVDRFCPEKPPAPGEECLLPEGTTCSFDGCGSSIAQCSLGVWRFGGNPPTRAICPRDFPARGVACPSCFPPEVECIYGSTDCTAADASLNQSRAHCVDAAWEIETRPCGTAPDAGADVQGDAGPDSD